MYYYNLVVQVSMADAGLSMLAYEKYCHISKTSYVLYATEKWLRIFLPTGNNEFSQRYYHVARAR